MDLLKTEAGIVGEFDIQGELRLVRHIGNGYVNRTYLVECYAQNGTRHRYTLQRINTNVFKDVDRLMDNYIRVTEHLCKKALQRGDSIESVPSVIRTHSGKSYFSDATGCWRMMSYFSHTYSMDIPESPNIFYLAGRSFGKFIRDVSDIPVNDIHIVIENFHNTYLRYCALEESIKEDPVDRVCDVKKEIAFIRSRKSLMSLISDALSSGKIPTRVTHNDTNLNNILFDRDTRQPVAIIDLDTVMPSSPLYDFGDSMRIGTNTACDDERDLSKVTCNLDLYRNYARGWLEECGSMLTKEELELLPLAAQIITLEDGIRFLKDYIDGDIYYTISRLNHNLDRSRTQLKLVEDMERKFPDICNILFELRNVLGI